MPVHLCAFMCTCAHTHDTNVYMGTHTKINSMREGGNTSTKQFLPSSSAVQQDSLNGYHGQTAHIPAVPGTMIRNCRSLSKYIRKTNSTSGPDQYGKGSASSVLQTATGASVSCSALTCVPVPQEDVTQQLRPSCVSSHNCHHSS